MDPLASIQQQQSEDMPRLDEAVQMAQVLLDLLPSAGFTVNAPIAHRVLRHMVSARKSKHGICCHKLWKYIWVPRIPWLFIESPLLIFAAIGRQALRQATVMLHSAETGIELLAGKPTALAVAAAAQWMANKFWSAASAVKAGDTGEQATLLDVCDMMRVVAIDEEVPFGLPPAPPARFAAALQNAVLAAAAAGLECGGDEHRWEPPSASHAIAASLVHDDVTELFYKNSIRVRGGCGVWIPDSFPSSKSGPDMLHYMQAGDQVAATAAFARFSRANCRADPPASLESLLHPPLALPKYATRLAFDDQEEVPLASAQVVATGEQATAEVVEQPQVAGPMPSAASLQLLLQDPDRLRKVLVLYPDLIPTLKELKGD